MHLSIAKLWFVLVSIFLALRPSGLHSVSLVFSRNMFTVVALFVGFTLPPDGLSLTFFDLHDKKSSKKSLLHVWDVFGAMSKARTRSASSVHQTVATTS